jgi:polysaccharide biosynthesis/export protein
VTPNQDTFPQRPATNSSARPFYSFRHSPQEQNAVASADNAGPVAMLRPVAIRAVSDDSPPAGDEAAGPWHAVPHPDEATTPEQAAFAGVGAIATTGAATGSPPQAEGQPRSEIEGQPAPSIHTAQAIPSAGPSLEKKVVPAALIGPPVVYHPRPGAPVPKEFEKHSLSSYVIEPPDILLIQGTAAIGLRTQQLQGTHLVRPDGTVGLGIYGEVYVAGMTIEQARMAVADALIRYGIRIEKLDEKGNKVDATKAETLVKELQVDVAGYNSKFYYLIADGAGYGQQVYRLPCTGNETVLDAISQVGGLQTVSCQKSIWLARATPYSCAKPKVLRVDWKGISQLGSAATNYQIYPGDRIYVGSDPLIRADSILNKILTPLERVTGGVLLGSTTRQSLGAKPNGQ